MGNSVAKICKGSSVVLLLLGIIGAFSIGKNSAVGLLGSGFNFSLFFYCLIACFFICLLFYSLGEIINQLEINNTYLKESSYYQNRYDLKENKDIKIPVPVSNVKKSLGGGWICKKCERENETYTAFCKDCGDYR